MPASNQPVVVDATTFDQYDIIFWFQ